MRSRYPPWMLTAACVLLAAIFGIPLGMIFRACNEAHAPEKQSRTSYAVEARR